MSIVFPEIWDSPKWFGGDESFFDNRSKLNIYEDEGYLIVEAALPGLEPHEIEATLNHGRLDIQGKKEKKESDKKFYRKSLQSFQYSTMLPSHVEDKQPLQAQLKDGILQIKFATIKNSDSKQIEIKKG